MNYEENVRAILQCCFSGFKDEIIENAVKCIVALKCEPVVIKPIDTTPVTPVMPAPMPIIPTPTYPQYPYGTPVITCTATAEDLKKLQNSDIINKEK